METGEGVNLYNIRDFFFVLLFCLCKTGNLDININNSSILLLSYDLIHSLFAWRIKWYIFVMKKFILGCRFDFETYEKNVRENATKVLLVTDEFLLDVDEHILDIYQVWYFSRYSSFKLFYKPHILLISWFYNKKDFVWCLVWNSSFLT